MAELKEINFYLVFGRCSKKKKKKRSHAEIIMKYTH